jgi:hypothetical protein
VVFGLALFTKVFIRLLALGKGQAHAVIVLPCGASIAADHVSLDILFLLIFTTDASNDFFFVLFAGSWGGFSGWFRRLLLGLALGLAFLRGDILYQLKVLVLALGGSARSSWFICLKLLLA